MHHRSTFIALCPAQTCPGQGKDRISRHSKLHVRQHGTRPACNLRTAAGALQNASCTPYFRTRHALHTPGRIMHSILQDACVAKARPLKFHPLTIMSASSALALAISIVSASAFVCRMAFSSMSGARKDEVSSGNRFCQSARRHAEEEPRIRCGGIDLFTVCWCRTAMRTTKKNQKGR